MAKKSFVTSAQNVVQDQAGKIVDMAKAGYEGAKSLVGDAVTGTAKTAKTLIGKPKRKAAGKSKLPAKKGAALKKVVTKKSSKNPARSRGRKLRRRNPLLRSQRSAKGPERNKAQRCARGCVLPPPRAGMLLDEGHHAGKLAQALSQSDQA